MPGAFTAEITENDNWHIGEDWEFAFVVDDGTVGSTPAGIENWEVEWFLRREAGHPTLILHYTLADQEIEFDGSNTFTVTVAGVDTEGLPPGQYWHTLSRVDTNEVHDLCEGRAVLLASARM